MKGLLKTCLPLALGLLPFSLEVRAQSMTAVGVARASEALIKIYDPMVRDVSLVVPAPEGTITACSKDNKSTNDQWEAYYCPIDRTIFISENNLKLIESRYGLAAIATLIAHEFAHGRQHALTGFLTGVVWTSVFDELQADCISGVYMRRATPISLSERQIAKSKAFLEDIGDYSVQERNWHGTPGMRGSVFQFGYNKGDLNACWASREKNWRKILEDIPSRIDKAIENAPAKIDKLIDQGLKFLESE